MARSHIHPHGTLQDREAGQAVLHGKGGESRGVYTPPPPHCCILIPNPTLVPNQTNNKSLQNPMVPSTFDAQADTPVAKIKKTQVKHTTTASTKAKNAGKPQTVTKFKIRCSRYLYTLTLTDAEKAEKLKQSLPPGVFMFSQWIGTWAGGRCVGRCWIDVGRLATARQYRETVAFPEVSDGWTVESHRCHWYRWGGCGPRSYRKMERPDRSWGDVLPYVL